MQACSFTRWATRTAYHFRPVHVARFSAHIACFHRGFPLRQAQNKAQDLHNHPSSSPHPFQSTWSTTDNVTFCREISPREEVMARLTSSYHALDLEEWFGTSTVHLKGGEDAWRSLLKVVPMAWQRLRHSHPGIACTLNMDTMRMEYRPCNSQQEVDNWVHDSIYIDNEATTPNEIYAKLKRKPSWWLCIAPKAKTLSLFANHWHADARGVTFLLGKLLQMCQEENPGTAVLLSGDEVARLPESADHLAGISVQAPPDKQALIRSTAEGLMAFDSVPGLPVEGNVAGPPAHSQFQHLALSRSESEAIFDACRACSISVTAAFQAATCLQTMSEADPAAWDKLYTAVIRREVRHLLPEPWCAVHNSADSMMITSTVKRVDPKTGFLTLARAFQEDYTTGFTRDDFQNLDFAVWAYIADLVRSGALTDRASPFLEVVLVSIGKINEHIPASLPQLGASGMQVENVEVGVTTYLPAESGLFLYTWDDRLNLCVGFNNAYRSQNAMVKYVQSTLKLLRGQLELG